jgi:hypothetical protein
MSPLLISVLALLALTVGGSVAKLVVRQRS